MAPNEPSLVATTLDLSRALTERSLLNDNLQELDLAVTLAKEAKRLASESKVTHPTTSQISFAQGQSLARRYHINRNKSDLDAAVDATSYGIERESDDTSKVYKSRLLAGLLCLRNKKRGGDKDLREIRKLVPLIIKDKHDQLDADSVFLITLTDILLRKHGGRCNSESIKATTPHDREDRDLINLDACFAAVAELLDYYGPMQNMAEVDDTIKYLDQLVGAIECDCTELPILLEGLCDNLEKKYAQTGELAWQDRARAYADRRLELVTETHVQRRAPGSFNVLAIMHCTRYCNPRNPEDVQNALTLLRHELHMHPRHTARAMWLASLAMVGEAHCQWSKDAHVLHLVLYSVEELKCLRSKRFPLHDSPRHLLAITKCYMHEYYYFAVSSAL
jgi:hypothetical protein